MQLDELQAQYPSAESAPAEALAKVGLLLAQQGKFDEALEVLNQAIINGRPRYTLYAR